MLDPAEGRDVAPAIRWLADRDQARGRQVWWATWGSPVVLFSEPRCSDPRLVTLPETVQTAPLLALELRLQAWTFPKLPTQYPGSRLISRPAPETQLSKLVVHLMDRSRTQRIRNRRVRLAYFLGATRNCFAYGRQNEPRRETASASSNRNQSSLSRVHRQEYCYD